MIKFAFILLIQISLLANYPFNAAIRKIYCLGHVKEAKICMFKALIFFCLVSCEFVVNLLVVFLDLKPKG